MVSANSELFFYTFYSFSIYFFLSSLCNLLNDGWTIVRLSSQPSRNYIIYERRYRIDPTRPNLSDCKHAANGGFTLQCFLELDGVQLMTMSL